MAKLIGQTTTLLKGLNLDWEDTTTTGSNSFPMCYWKFKQPRKRATKKIPYSLVFGSEAVILVEIGATTQRTINIDLKPNKKETILNLKLLKEARD